MYLPTLPSLRSWFESNPVFKRELRARWRRPAAYLTLFFYAAPLALGMVLFYGDIASTLSSDTSLATIGENIFEVLVFAQIMGWLFISALTAAPVIAIERERGLLEALQLANLKASHIVWGKCLSLFSFQALLFLVPLPVVAICFLLGGVDPKTFVLSTVTIAVTALCGTMIGLYFSSTRPRPGAALRDALIFIVIWTALASFSGTHISSYLGWPVFIRQPLAVAELLHPFNGVRWMGNENFQWPVRNILPGESPGGFPFYQGFNPATGPLYTTISSQTAWQLFLAGLLMLSLLLFMLTVRNTARILPEAEFIRRVEPKKIRANKKTAKTPEKSPIRTEHFLYYELPTFSRHSFNNPIFGRELRGKTRWRAASPLTWLLRGALLCAPLGLIIDWFVNDNLVYGRGNPDLPTHVALLGLAMPCLYAAVCGATVFTRERESNTWESLHLSLLTPRQILHGKIWPIAIALTVLTVPLLMALCIYSSTADKFSLWAALGITAIVLATAFAVSSVAMFISWLARTTQVALGLSLAINAVLMVLIYMFSLSINDIASLRSFLWWNPIVAVESLVQMPNFDDFMIFNGTVMPHVESPPDYTLQILALLSAFTMLGVASILIVIISALMRQKFRDEK